MDGKAFVSCELTHTVGPPKDFNYFGDTVHTSSDRKSRRLEMLEGETLLLLPIQRCLDLLPSRLSMGSARRCLFGRPDPVVISKAKDLAQDRERMIRDWDFDIVKERPVYPPKRYPWVEAVPQTVPATAAASPAREKRESRKRNRVTPYQQLQITDFWRTRKFDGFNKTTKTEAELSPSSGESSSSEQNKRQTSDRNSPTDHSTTKE